LIPRMRRGRERKSAKSKLLTKKPVIKKDRVGTRSQN
jgi:hypothetical protein